MAGKYGGEADAKNGARNGNLDKVMRSVAMRWRPRRKSTLMQLRELAPGARGKQLIKGQEYFSEKHRKPLATHTFLFLRRIGCSGAKPPIKNLGKERYAHPHSRVSAGSFRQ